jgi:uncharacterized membrane protein YczE
MYCSAFVFSLSLHLVAAAWSGQRKMPPLMMMPKSACVASFFDLTFFFIPRQTRLSINQYSFIAYGGR